MNEMIALDLNPYCSRAVLLDPTGIVLSHADSKEPYVVRRWLAAQLDQHPEARVVSSPLEDCPAELESELRARRIYKELLNPTLCRALFHAGRKWNLPRKLHRARLYAHLQLNLADPWTLAGHLREYEHELAREVLSME